MKRVSLRTRDQFMRVILSAARKNGMPLVDSNDPALDSLRKRRDFEQVIDILVNMEFIAQDRFGRKPPPVYEITRTGICYFEKRADERYRLFVNSVLIPVLVAIITTTVTVYILPSLGQSAKRWLENYQSRSQTSSPAIETTSDPSLNQQLYPEYPE